jgi:metal-sulfur cluster biosynthetic enzyme
LPNGREEDGKVDKNKELELKEKLSQVEHPEIACSLEKLGMIRDVNLAQSGEQAQLTLVLPVLAIPIIVKNMLVHALSQAAESVGVSLEVKVEQMSTEERDRFLGLARSHWRDQGSDAVPCG